MYWILFLLFTAMPLNWLIPGHSRKGHINKFCQSFSLEVFLELVLYFFLESNMVLGAHEVLCMIWSDLLKIMFCPQNGENRPSLMFFKCMGKFSFFSQFFNFFSIWSLMKVCIIVIAVCLKKFHIWENSGSWDTVQNALGQSDCGIFQSFVGL